ncbi:MAG: sugar nucleotide-binding protein [Planctomycetaceae bacterium]|nr:sugar nucleotide-binding protein [Planctomycetaceae bacterium]
MAKTLPFDPFELNQPRNDRPLLQVADRLPILVTGVAGVVGFNIFHYLQQKYPGQVVGIRPRINWRLQGDGIVGLDPEDVNQVRALFQQYPFRSILSCGGSCALKSCELDPDMAHRVNVSSVQSLIDVAAEAGQSSPEAVRLVHVSIDLVYSGRDAGGYLETDATDPVTIYGKTMVLAEQMLQAQRPDAAILRISLPMGLSFNGHAGAIDWIQSRFARGFPATLYYDEIRTPTYCECLNEQLETMLSGDWNGVFHAGGPTRLSLFQIAQIVNLVGGYDPKLLHGCMRHEAGPIPPRAGDVTMDSSKLNRLFGRPLFRPWPFDERLIPTDREWHYRRDWFPNGSKHKIAELLYQAPRPTLVIG